jgi:hypothetical protein
MGVRICDLLARAIYPSNKAETCPSIQNILRMGKVKHVIEYQSSIPSEPKFLLSDLSEESVPNIYEHE